MSASAPPCCAYNPVAVLISGQSGFELDLTGSSLVVDPGIALSSAIHFDRDYDFRMRGGLIEGSRLSLAQSAENVAIALSNVRGGIVQDVTIGPGFEANGAAFAGDWLADTSIQDVRVDDAGQCMDFSFVYNLRVAHLRATGGGGGMDSRAGEKCFSLVRDTVNSGNNRTGIPFSKSSNVRIAESTMSNFDTDVLLSSGSDVRFDDDVFVLPSRSTEVAPTGLLVKLGRGEYDTLDDPPNRVTVSNSIFLAAVAAASGRDIAVELPTRGPSNPLTVLNTISCRAGLLRACVLLEANVNRLTGP